MIKVNKQAPLYSGRVGVSPERADELWATLFVITAFRIREVQGRTGYTDGMLYSDILENFVILTDQNDLGEVFYAGFKFQEFLTLIAKKGFSFVVDKVNSATRETDTMTEAINYFKVTVQKSM